MDTELFAVETGARRVTDLTPIVASFCDGRGDGLCHVFAPHATAGLALMELGSGSERDLDELLDRLLPRDDRYRHRHGSPGHGADHLLPVLVSPSLTSRWPADSRCSVRGSPSCSSIPTATTRAGTFAVRGSPAVRVIHPSRHAVPDRRNETTPPGRGPP